MKKLLGIFVFGLLLDGSVLAENLGIDKTVNDYVNNDYTIVSVETIDETSLVYTLRSNAKNKPLVVSCIYSPTKQVTICFKP
jgi:hypothetical protein|tara:strand:- start:2 stop:247 length:246 start_codon:yes stop_codon:yes gene_type:complete